MYSYLDYYSECLKANKLSKNPEISDILSLISQYDESTIISGDGMAKQMRDFALFTLRLSFISTLSNEEKSIYILDDKDGVSTDTKQKLVDFSDKFLTTSLCDGEFVNELLNSTICEINNKDGIIGDTDFINAAIEFIQFARRTEVLLASGGDDRLTLNMNTGRINKYFCSTLPRPWVLRRGSCTCSTTTMSQFKIADEARIRMTNDALKAITLGTNCTDAALSVNDSIRKRLGTLMDIDSESTDDPKIVFFPSGSDAELLPVFVAFARTKGEVVNIVTAAGEVGSGTPNAANVRHFSSLKTMGGTQVNDGPLDGYDGKRVKLVKFKPRVTDGSVDYKEKEMMDLIDSHLTDTDKIVILHLVLGSKTGLLCPTQACIDSVVQKWGDRVICVADACQLRCSLSHIKNLVDKNVICLITSSKFFEGPPFSGGVIVPAKMSADLEAHLKSDSNQVPIGTNGYLTPYDIPKSMSGFRNYLTMKTNAWSNPGLSLRWLCGIESMEKFCSVPSTQVDSFISKWVKNTKKIVNDCHPYLEVLDVPLGVDGSPMIGAGNNTIVSIIPNIQENGEFRRLTTAECKKFHQLIGANCSNMYDCTEDEEQILTQVAMLGQTVELSSELSILRIALGASMVNDALKNFNTDVLQMAFDIHQVLNVDSLVVKKMRLLLKFWGQKNRMELADSRVAEFQKENGKRSVDSAFASLNTLTHVIKKLDNNLPISAVFYDLDALDASFQSVITAFESAEDNLTSENFVHCFAVKSCPLSYILHRAIQNNLGMECASIVEVLHSINSGCPPNRIVYDSPIKTIEEIKIAVEKGVNLNVNSFTELEKLDEVVAELGVDSIKGCLGIRVNPLVGAGSIAELSVATRSSKFGIPLTDDIREKIIGCFKDRPYLNAVMCHVGSQGMPIDLLASGADTVFKLANDIDNAVGCNRIKIVDIGGGLTANYGSDDVNPSFMDLVTCIKKMTPTFFSLNARKGRKVLTEFGKSLVTKCGIVATTIEDVLEPLDPSENTIACVHSGADLFVRTAYAPTKFYHRIGIFDRKGDQKTSSTVRVNVVGPLCFSGDILATGIELSKPVINDIVYILDSGANTFSLYSRHCSRQAPAVFGICASEDGKKVLAIKLKEMETYDDVMAFWK